MRNCNLLIWTKDLAQLKVRILRLLVIGCALVFSYQVAAQPDLKVITEDWAPYNYEEGSELKGFSIEIVQAVMNELGEQYPISIYPGARGDRMLETLPNVMYFSLFRTPEREDKFKWIGPISQEAIYFYKRKDNLQTYKTIDDIKQANNITVPYKGLVANKVDELGITNVIKLSARDRQFSLLFSNRAELAVNTSPLGVAYYLKQIDKPVDSLVATGVKLLEFPLYIACSKEIPDSVIERWQAALEKVKASEKYEQIYSKYLM
ncbi:substrate-binding periplasmic protein [Neptuniibacter sp. QD34_54]|uniref:substrate-binding periplasmic protein n=1 Tax=unclassified Neptuniibacter TaxID=2630693 RepID=UPI0039F64E3A